jgi:hypothetical protein
MLQGREKDADGKIRIVEKEQIDGRQTKPEVFYNFTTQYEFLFNNQSVYFGIFIALFLTGYELFKRYSND